MNVSKRKNKTKKSAQEEEVTCWNCFTVEDNDRNLESVPLPKVREEHREKLKVYSFLASELSKPKAVPLKQKVSEHYAIGKKIDEKISCQVSAECLSVNNVDTSLNNKNDIKNESRANKYLSNEDIDINEKNLLSCQNQINTESSLSNKIISSENIKNNINQNETKLLSTDDKNISQIQECNNKVKSLHKENIYKNSIIQSNEHSDIETSFNKKPEILNLNNKVFEKTSIHDVYEDCSTNKMSKTVSSEFMSLDKPPNESRPDHNSTKRLLEFNIKKSIEPERKALAKMPSIREQKSLKEIGKKGVESLHEENLSKNSTIQISENNDIKTSFYKKSKLLDIDKKVSDEIGIQVEFEDCGTNKILKTLSSEFMSLDTPPNEDNTDHNSTKTLPEFNTCKSTKLENKTLLNTSLLSEHKSSENNCSSNISDTKSLDITEHEIFESVLEKMSKLSISNSIDSKENTSPVKTDLTIKQQKSPSAEIACKNKSSTIDYAHRDETNKMKQSKPLQNNYKGNEIKTTFENVIDMTNKEKIPTGASSSPMLSQTKIKKLSSKSLSSDSSIIRDDIQDACPSKLESPMTVKVFKSREITKLSPPLVTKAIERKSIEKLTSQKLSSYRDVEKDQNKAESTSDNIVVQKNKATNILPIHNKEDDKLTSSLADKKILFPLSEKKSIVLSTSLRAESVNTKIPILQKSVSSKYSPVQILRNKAKHYLTRNSSNASDKLSPTFIRSLSIKNYVNQENKQTSGAFKSSLKDDLEHSACENIENANILFKVPINTSTPKEKRCESSDTFSESESNQTSLEIKDTIASNNKNDNASSNGSESGYAGSSANIQYLPGDENTSKNFHNPKDTNKNDNNALPHSSEHFKSSITSLNIINNKKPLQTSTMSLYTTSKKSPLKFLRWRTSSMVPRSVSFEDEVYMSEALSSPGHATLPRRSNSPLPNERDLDRDRFPINRSGLQARSESMASVYSGAGEGLRGSVTVRGEVQFSLVYNYRLGALEVGVKRCRDLAPIDVKRNRSDPYVKVYLLPDKSKAGKRKTKVKKNTLSPVFEETLTFSQPLSSLSSRTLWLSVWHADMFGRNDFLGEVTLPLADVVFDDPAPMWYKLHERTEQFDEQQGSRGDLIIGLKFELQDAARGKGTLHVLVKEAKNLVATKPNGLADVFCKSYLLPERGRLTKQKTSVCRRTLHPRWEHTFTYRGVGARELATRALELSLWDRDRIASNDFMGAVRLSLGTGTYMGASVNWMDSVGKEVSLWQTMMQRPNFWVEGSLPLRPQLNN